MAAGKGIQIVVGTDYNDRDLKRAQRDLNNLSRTQKTALGPMGKMASGMKGQLTPGFAAMGAAAAAAGAAIAAMAIQLAVDGVQAAAQEEQALAKLQTALNNVGQGFMLSQVEGFIDDLQRATGVADDELRPALQTLVTATGDATQAQDLLSLALDVSAATGRDLTSVSSALAKAANGQFTQLNRLTNGAINPSILATKDLGLITAEVARLFGGQAQASADTFAGKISRLKIAFDELLESFGEGFIEGLTEGSEVTDDLSDAFRSAEPGMKEFGVAIGELARLFSYVAPLIDDFVNLLKYAVPAAIAAAVAAFPPLMPILGFLGIELGESKKAVDALDTSGDDISDTFHGPVSSALQATAYDLGDVTVSSEEAEDALKSLNDEMKAFFGFMDQRDAVRGYQASVDDLRKSLKENGKSFDVNTEAGRANQEALDDIYDSALDVAEGQATAAQKVKTLENAQRQAAAELEKMGLSPEAIQRLLQPFDDAIAKFRESTTEVDNLKQAMETIPREIVIQIKSTVVGGKPPGVSAEEWYGAKGGVVPRYMAVGGGARGSDTVPAMLAPGEFVVRRQAVKQFGADIFSQLNRGINPLAGMSPTGSGRAGGFSIGTINVTSAAGERADTSLPRALRRMAFLAGMNG